MLTPLNALLRFRQQRKTRSSPRLPAARHPYQMRYQAQRSKSAANFGADRQIATMTGLA